VSELETIIQLTELRGDYFIQTKQYPGYGHKAAWRWSPPLRIWLGLKMRGVLTTIPHTYNRRVTTKHRLNCTFIFYCKG